MIEVICPTFGRSKACGYGNGSRKITWSCPVYLSRTSCLNECKLLFDITVVLEVVSKLIYHRNGRYFGLATTHLIVERHGGGVKTTP